MLVRVDNISAPLSITEAMNVLKRQKGTILWAGGSLLSQSLPETEHIQSIIDLGHISELTTLSRSERYLELGSCVTLSTILNFPNKIILEPLRQAISSIGTTTIRNLATIGGNIANNTYFSSCFAPLACMDAMLELRDVTGAKWKNIYSIVDKDNKPCFPENTILTRIRIPTQAWTFAVTRHIGNRYKNEPLNAIFSATMRFSKGVISEIRLVATYSVLIRARELEQTLTGKKLPLSAKDIEEASEQIEQIGIESGLDSKRSMLLGMYVSSFLQESQEGYE